MIFALHRVAHSLPEPKDQAPTRCSQGSVVTPTEKTDAILSTPAALVNMATVLYRRDTASRATLALRAVQKYTFGAICGQWLDGRS